MALKSCHIDHDHDCILKERVLVLLPALLQHATLRGVPKVECLYSSSPMFPGSKNTMPREHERAHASPALHVAADTRHHLCQRTTFELQERI